MLHRKRKTLLKTLPYDLAPGPWPPEEMEKMEETPTRTRPVTPDRVQRRNSKLPRWPLVVALVIGVILIGFVTIMVMDVQRGELVSKDPTPATNVPRPVFDEHLRSIDDVADDLEKHGFRVLPLNDFTDAQLLAYEAGETKINGVPANILSFADRSTVQEWVNASAAFHGIAVVGDSWAISLSSEAKDRARSKVLAEKIAAKIGGKAQYR